MKNIREIMKNNESFSKRTRDGAVRRVIFECFKLQLVGIQKCYNFIVPIKQS